MDTKALLESKLDQLGEQIDTKLNSAVEAQKANLHQELDNLKANELKGLTEQYSKLQGQVDSLESATLRKSGASAPKNWMGELVDKIKSSDNFANEVRTHKGATFSVPSFKALPLVPANDLTGDVVPPDYVPGIVFDPDRAQHVRDFVPNGTTSSDVIRYIQETAYTDNTNFRDQGSTAGTQEFTLEAKDAPVRQISNYVRLTTEMLDDIPGLTAYISARLPKKIRVKEDNALLYGVDASFQGLTEVASAWTDTLADSNVNRYDVLISAIAQVRDGEYQANAIMVHPDDYYNLLLIKDAYGAYVMPDQFRFGSELPRIAGVPLIANTAISTGDFLVGDFSLGCQVFDRQASNIRFFEQDQDNAIKGLITVVANERLAFPIYRTNAFVYGDFASALAYGSA